jgi:hypothetical protein
VRVGAEKKEYHIHKELLRTNSAFFNNALKKEWAEGQDLVIEMPETDDEPFGIWAKWLYTGRVFLMKDGDVKEVKGVHKHKEWPRWLRCYTLGSFPQDSDFKDACIDVSIEAMCATKRIPDCLPETVYSSSSKASSHRKLAVDCLINCRARSSWPRQCGYPADFLADALKHVLPKLAQGVTVQSPELYFNLNEICQYHDHESEKPCYKTEPAFRFWFSIDHSAMVSTNSLSCTFSNTYRHKWFCMKDATDNCTDITSLGTGLHVRYRLR